MKGFESGRPMSAEDKAQEEANRKQIGAMIGEDLVGETEKFDDKNNMSDKERTEANIDQVNTMFDESRVSPPAESAKKTEGLDAQGEAMQAWIDRNSENRPASTAKAEVAPDNQAVENSKVENSEKTANKEKSFQEIGRNLMDDLSEKFKGILGRGKARWENVKKGIAAQKELMKAKAKEMGVAAFETTVGAEVAGAEKVSEMSKKGAVNIETYVRSAGIKGVQIAENIGEAGQAAMEKGKRSAVNAEAYIRSAGIRGVQAAEFVGSVAKNTAKEVGEFGKGAVGLAVEGGKMIDKGIEFIFNKADEKLDKLVDRSIEAFGNLKAKTRLAKKNFLEFINKKRMERTDRKYWEKIGQINTKIAELEILRDKYTKENDWKRKGRLNTEIAQLEIDRERMGYKEDSDKVNPEEKGGSNAEEFKQAA